MNRDNNRLEETYRDIEIYFNGRFYGLEGLTGLKDASTDINDVRATIDNLLTVYCDVCNDVIIDLEDSRSNSDYNHICINCQDDFYYCDRCEQYHHSDDMRWIEDNDTMVCDDCLRNYEQCEQCGKHYTEGNTTADGHDLCSDCFVDYTRCCDNCYDTYYNESSIRYYDSADAYLCNECRPNEASRDRIMNYSHKPQPIFYNTPTDHGQLRHYGLELEVQQGGQSNNNAKEIMDNYQELYVKADCSLEDGFEVVSHPCTIDYHHNNLDWDALCRWLRNKDYESGKGAGLHIHASKDNIPEIAQAKIAYICNAKFYDHIRKFARRRLDDANKWAPKADNIEEYFNTHNTDSIENDRQEHYRIVDYATYYRGITNYENDHTIEFRIFRSTLSNRIIQASIQLVDNIIEIAEAHTFTELSQMSFKTVLTYNSSYSELIKYGKQKFSDLF